MLMMSRGKSSSVNVVNKMEKLCIGLLAIRPFVLIVMKKIIDKPDNSFGIFDDRSKSMNKHTRPVRTIPATQWNVFVLDAYQSALYASIQLDTGLETKKAAEHDQLSTPDQKGKNVHTNVEDIDT
ncbi:hypothetical protein BLNAU_1491 [Blattamonas nauphoetae]|uniref:Uncharacterized protein n=1 Tax=Blattamonas nauphoetae TaxID=2049346 RepID=A0ABQ9YI70_9EUKA|nr:hypothetical protein BLNAU_1491 [Blattamonas nauphoetae]